MTRTHALTGSAIVVLLGLAACGNVSSPAASADQLRQRLPDDPNLAALYAQTCQACHANPASGAPLVGEAEQWAPRLAKGMNTLLGNTISGINGMPPLGSCGDCGEEEFTALIQFMSGQHS